MLQIINSIQTAIAEHSKQFIASLFEDLSDLLNTLNIRIQNEC